MEALKLLTPDQIKDIDKYAIEKLEFPELLLMENAAHAVYREVSNHFPDFDIVVMCGPGNNGGDGLALARILKSEGWNVKLSLISENKYRGSSKVNFNLSRHIEKIKLTREILTPRTLIIDALFGIGLNRALKPYIEEIISYINNSPSKVVSIDIPTGICALTGNILGQCAIKADMTVTLCSPKIGMYKFPGFNYCGQIVTAGISLPDFIFESIKAPILNTPLLIPERDKNCNKRSYGKILTIAGSTNYYGAPYFSSKAALLAGSGYSTLISSDSVIKVCATIAPEIIYREESEIDKCFKDATSVVFGPGVGLSTKSRKLLKSVIEYEPDNLILDGDALSLIAEDSSVLNNYSKPFVMTPHTGEASRLLSSPVSSVNEDPLKSALAISKKFNCITILKGAHTIITTPEKDIFINICSSPNLATAGSGDILSGLISGLTGQLPLLEAVRAAVYIHGLSGVILEKRVGKSGITAVNILDTIPESINKYRHLRISDSFPAL